MIRQSSSAGPCKYLHKQDKKLCKKVLQKKVKKKSNTAKGVNIATEFNEFKDTLFNKKIIKHKMRRIQGKKHKMGTYEINKISLSVFDDKIFVLDDGIHTLAYFHKDLKNHR